MSDESAESPDEADSDGEEGVEEEVEAAHDDPDRRKKDEKYDDRHGEARETANPDDHRDEEPHQS